MTEKLKELERMVNEELRRRGCSWHMRLVNMC
jgi:hypothetical protein